MIHIRQAKVKDIDQIHQLDKESVEYHKKFDRQFYTVSRKWWKIKKASQIKALKKSSDLILLAEKNKRVIGYIWGYVEKMAKFNVGKIQDLIVTSQYRNRGIATRLIKRMLKFFMTKKCVISDVEVYIKNNPAIDVYEKTGFVKQNYRMRLKLGKVKSFSPFS
jgi:ribosomal protein S18 acetylase RimI-like enzyme